MTVQAKEVKSTTCNEIIRDLLQSSIEIENMKKENEKALAKVQANLEKIMELKERIRSITQ
jgi:hypothetical protein